MSAGFECWIFFLSKMEDSSLIESWFGVGFAYANIAPNYRGEVSHIYFSTIIWSNYSVDVAVGFVGILACPVLDKINVFEKCFM